MAPLCGVHKQACIRKYGGKPMRTEYCHELAVRLLIGCLVMTAAKHELGVKVVFSYSTLNYIRIYVVVNRGVKHADDSVQRLGYVLHCFSCFHREASRGPFSFLNQRCSRCGATLNLAGPSGHRASASAVTRSRAFRLRGQPFVRRRVGQSSADWEFSGGSLPTPVKSSPDGIL